jgi:aldehyde dehydrogenase (NAD(P)+)
MSHAQVPLSGNAESSRPTPRADLDRAVADVAAKQVQFARMPPREKARLLREIIPLLEVVAKGWVEAGCRAKGIAAGSPLEAEEWFVGPVITVRNARLLSGSLEEIARHGRPPLGRRVHERADGRVEIDVFPASALDSAVFSSFSASVLLEAGVTAAQARERQASFYQGQSPAGGVALVLGAGNVSSIPPTDVFYKLFACGQVCILKMNPVNEWVGPFLARALHPLIERDYLRIVYGGGDVGAYLIDRPEITDIHITGSDRTHDLIVWGPPGPERDRRKAAGDPLLKKTITSELGNVSPVSITPGQYSDDELWFQARATVTMVANNASFNCNAGKVLILGEGWPQRDAFMGMLKRAFALVPPRKAYYPGAHDRYRDLTAGRERVERFGQAREGELPWALIEGVDASREGEKLFHVEPFCGILSQTSLPAADPIDFLAATTRFCNERLWGTLNAALVVPSRVDHDHALKTAVERAVTELRYGTVAINHWPALGYALITPPWGGHPSATLANIQSGIGFVHNTYMIEGIEKAVVRGPLLARPKPPWFFDHKRAEPVARRLVSMEARPSWWKLPALASAAMRG